MGTCNDVRRFALAQEGVQEINHRGRPTFPTKERIFITLRPHQRRAIFHLPEEHQQELRADTFEPLHRGKATRCFANLQQLPAREISVLVREAWEHAVMSGKRTRGSGATRPGKVPRGKPGQKRQN